LGAVYTYTISCTHQRTICCKLEGDPILVTIRILSIYTFTNCRTFSRMNLHIYNFLYKSLSAPNRMRSDSRYDKNWSVYARTNCRTFSSMNLHTIYRISNKQVCVHTVPSAVIWVPTALNSMTIGVTLASQRHVVVSRPLADYFVVGRRQKMK
jgi:hypothetical protein